MGIFKYTVFSFSVTHGILYFFYDLVLRNAAALPTMARYRQLCVKILTRLYSTRYPRIPVARNYVSAHTLTDEKVLIPSPDSRRHTIYFHENLLSSRETQAFCGTRVAWCIPPARKLICPGDYAPYFIMRRYIYIFPPGREPSPCYQNKDDRTTPPPPPSLFSFPFFSPLSHSCAVSIALTPPSNHYAYANPPAPRSLRVYPFFFLIRHRIYLSSRKIKDMIFFEKIFNLLSSEL